MEKRQVIIFFLLPALIPLLLFGIYPTAYAFYLSFTFYNLKAVGAEPYFYGLGNFIDLFNDSLFQQSIIVTVIFALLFIPLAVLISLAQALILSTNIKGVKILQVLAIIPWGIPTVVSASFFKFIFEANFGLFNDIMTKLGLITSYQSWTSIPSVAMLIVVLAYLWVQVPLPTLLFLAGIQSIPQELYEAAEIDGAKRLAKFKVVIFDWLRPIFLIVLVYVTLQALWAFDAIYTITFGGPAGNTKVLAFFTYEKMFTMLNFGQAGAVSILTLFVTAFLIFLYFKALRIGRIRLRV